MVDGLNPIGRRNIQFLFGNDQTLAAKNINSPATQLTMQEASLLNFFARCPLENRAEEWPKIQDQFEDDSFAQQVALFLLREPKKSVDSLVKDYAIWLLESCGVNDEAEELRKVA